jgi:outer membrane protein TolC
MQNLVPFALATMLGVFSLAGGEAPAPQSQPPASSQDVDPRILAFLKPVEVPAGASELQQKLRERHNVAVKLLEERVNEYRKGVRDVSSVFEATRLTADAKLDLAETRDARVVVLGQVLDIAKLIESKLEERLKKGFGSKSDVEQARLSRLNVEVELLRAKAKDVPVPK